MPWRMESFVGAVLAHRANPDAVLHCDAPDLDGSEQLWYRLAGELICQSRPRSWHLSRSEERDILCCLVFGGCFVYAILGGCGCSETRNDGTGCDRGLDSLRCHFEDVTMLKADPRF